MKSTKITLAEFEEMLELDKARKLFARAYKGRPKPRRQVQDYEGSWRFRDLYCARFPDQSGFEVLIERSEPRPLIESGRLAELMKGGERDAAAGGRLLAALERSGGWVDVYDVLNSEKHLAAKMWLADQDVAVQASDARYQSSFWIAHSRLKDEQITGGITRIELRLDPSERQLPLFAVVGL